MQVKNNAVGEGGKDDTWYHDPIDGQIDNEWRRRVQKIIAGEKLKEEIRKSNIDESDSGQSNYESELLYKIETEGHALSDTYWMEHRLEIHQLVRDGLVEQLDTSYISPGGVTRTLKLTPRGRLKMLIGRKETSGRLSV